MKSDLIHFETTYLNLLTYSTWLVVGGWLIFTGAELIYKTAAGDIAFFNYLLGAIRLLAGANALRTARSVARKSNEPDAAIIRLMVFMLLTMMFILPLLLFIFQTLIFLFGVSQPDERYRENVSRLLCISTGYMLAVIFADRRLRK